MVLIGIFAFLTERYSFHASAITYTIDKSEANKSDSHEAAIFWLRSVRSSGESIWALNEHRLSGKSISFVKTHRAIVLSFSHGNMEI
jgi:hypothetical protein